MGKTTRLPDPVVKEAESVKEERDYSSLGDAVRFMCREGGFDV